MRARHGEQGSVIFYIIIALVSLSAMSVAVSGISSASVASEVEVVQLNTARYLAESGILYAKGLAASYKKQSKTIAQLVTALNANSGTVTIPNVGSFVLSATASGNTVVVSVKGLAKSGLARYAIPSTTSIAYTSSSAPTSQALQGLYSETGSYMSGTFAGNLTTKTTSLNGGTVISGSLTYNSSASGCLDLTGGVTIGTAGASNYVCSNTCVIIENGAIVNGNVYSAGNVSISSTVNGDVYAGGNVTLGWGAVVNGNIYTHGTFTYPPYFTSFTGKVTYNYPIPAACSTYTLPAHETVASKKKLVVNSTQTFYGTSDIGDHSLAYTSIYSGYGTKICFDLSTPGTYINIFDSGDMTINGDLYVRTSATTACFDAANKVDSVAFAQHAHASRVYMDVKGAVAFNGGSSWFGTLYAGGNITPGGGGAYIGALYTNGIFNPPMCGGVTTRFVASDYVTKYWP